jgi:hypothetical protein
MNLPTAGIEPVIEGLSAITLSTRDMRGAVRFYQALSFPLLHGGEAFKKGALAEFTAP